ncbi:MAG: hypothetical protein QXW80_05170 [Candidatus Micrarchaeia archaeon]
MESVTIKVDKELKKRMKEININWSEYIRDAIRRKIELEERKEAASKLIQDLRYRKHPVPKDFVNQSIRETRESR